jgi:hypothetical protein
MVVWTFFQVVPLWIAVASNCFEQVEVQEGDALRHLDVLSAVVAILRHLLALERRLLVRNRS